MALPQPPTLYFLFLTTHKPTGAVYVGIHASTDHNFGTEQFRDPFIGGGNRVKALRSPRDQFEVRTLHVDSTFKACLDRFNKLPINYDHPLCLNDKPGAKSDVPKASPTAKA